MLVLSDTVAEISVKGLLNFEELILTYLSLRKSGATIGVVCGMIEVNCRLVRLYRIKLHFLS